MSDTATIDGVEISEDDCIRAGYEVRGMGKIEVNSRVEEIVEFYGQPPTVHVEGRSQGIDEDNVLYVEQIGESEVEAGASAVPEDRR